MTLNYIGMISIFIGYHNRNNCTTIITYGNFVSILISQKKQISLFAVNSGLKV